jgi:hypothetical protein
MIWDYFLFAFLSYVSAAFVSALAERVKKAGIDMMNALALFYCSGHNVDCVEKVQRKRLQNLLG